MAAICKLESTPCRCGWAFSAHLSLTRNQARRLCRRVEFSVRVEEFCLGNHDRASVMQRFGSNVHHPGSRADRSKVPNVEIDRCDSIGIAFEYRKRNETQRHVERCPREASLRDAQRILVTSRRYRSGLNRSTFDAGYLEIEKLGHRHWPYPGESANEG
jgi:hypothetical protein